jgi:hypothetical protein
MKKQFKTCVTIILIASLQTIYFSSKAQNASKSPSMIGTYIYELEGQEGICIVSKTHFVWVITDKSRKPFQGGDPSESEKAAAYTGANADGGTYKFIGPSRITIHRLFSVNPALVGKEFTFEYEFEGELCKYWMLEADGSRGSMGKARRIEK